MPGKPIKSVVGFLNALERYKAGTDEDVFFRGHDNRTHMLQPSVFRRPNHEANEHRMYMDLLATNPEEFAGDSTAFERLVRMQHYGLPTRLLDLSSNPLVGLYFACSNGHATDGEVIVLRVKTESIRYFDSPTVACMSNLARLSKVEKDTLDTSLIRTDFNELQAARKLSKLVGFERPQFQPDIDPLDLLKCLVVRPKLNNARIVAQSGAFVICGKVHEVKTSAEIRLGRIRVNKNKKDALLKSLELLNIGERAVYPAIEKTALFFKNKYQ